MEKKPSGPGISYNPLRLEGQCAQEILDEARTHPTDVNRLFLQSMARKQTAKALSQPLPKNQ